MEIPAIETQIDYEAALARIDRLMDHDPAANSDTGRDLKRLVILVEEYEDIHYPMIST